jgi:hypothetical protein
MTAPNICGGFVGTSRLKGRMTLYIHHYHFGRNLALHLRYDDRKSGEQSVSVEIFPCHERMMSEIGFLGDRQNHIHGGPLEARSQNNTRLLQA